MLSSWTGIPTDIVQYTHSNRCRCHSIQQRVGWCILQSLTCTLLTDTQIDNIFDFRSMGIERHQVRWPTKSLPSRCTCCDDDGTDSLQLSFCLCSGYTLKIIVPFNIDHFLTGLNQSFESNQILVPSIQQCFFLGIFSTTHFQKVVTLLEDYR